MAVGLAYACLAGWVAWRAPKTIAGLQDSLPWQLAAIYRPAVPAIPDAQTPPLVPVSHTLGSPPPAAGMKAPITALSPITVTPMTTQASAKPGVAVGLPPAPISGLFETTPQGRLPVIRTGDRMTPFAAYRQPFAVGAARPPLVAIVVADLGLSAIQTQGALAAMPGMVTLDFSPYTFDATRLINQARAKGHEVWLTLPVESEDYPGTDTGANTLLIGASPPQNIKKLNQVLGSAVGYAGLIASARPAFLKSATDAGPILNAIYQRGLVVVDQAANASPPLLAAAKAKNSNYGAVDLWLDQEATPDSIQAALAQLEKRVRTQGAAVAMIHPLPVSYQVLSRWLATLPGKGITLVPLSALTKPVP